MTAMHRTVTLADGTARGSTARLQGVPVAACRHASLQPCYHACLPRDDCPMQCRTYPFWPEPLTSRHDWEAEALRCEGIQLQSSALPRQHRQQHSDIDHTRHSGAHTASP